MKNLNDTEAFLTNDAKVLICRLYDAYLYKVDSGTDRVSAAYFKDASDIKEAFMPERTEEEVSEICWELKRAHFLHAFPGDDRANNVSLTRDAIAAMENRLRGVLGDFLHGAGILIKVIKSL